VFDDGGGIGSDHMIVDKNFLSEYDKFDVFN